MCVCNALTCVVLPDPAAAVLACLHSICKLIPSAVCRSLRRLRVAERCMLEHTIVVPTALHNVPCIHATCFLDIDLKASPGHFTVHKAWPSPLSCCAADQRHVMGDPEHIYSCAQLQLV